MTAPARAERRHGDAGVSILEMLIATTIMMAVTGAAFELLDPVQGTFQAQPEAADVQQRLRVAVAALTRDIVMAGAGLDDGAGAAPYNVLAPAMPYRRGQTRDDPGAGVFYRPDTLTVVSVPEPTAPARESHTYYLKPDAATGAYRLMHYDGEVTDSPVVDNVVALAFEYFGDPRPPALIAGDDPDHAIAPRTTYGAAPPALSLDAEAEDEYGPGENCVFAVSGGRHVSRLVRLGDHEGDVRLEPAVLSDGPWCPGSASPDRYDADLLRVRRIRMAIRLQAAAPFRGPAGVLFSRGGTATTAPRRVPDRGVTFDIAPRNMNPSGWP